MARGDREWDALAAHLRSYTPPCDGDVRFTIDTPTAVDLESMSRLCADCPLRELCASYGDATRPAGTYWAGKFYPAAKEGTP